jgi:excisionase family DNA binding protein
LPTNYNRRELRNPKVEIIFLDDVRNAEKEIDNENIAPSDVIAKQKAIAPASPFTLPGVPLFEFRPRQPLSDEDRQRVAQAMGAEAVALPRHPELGEGAGFRLGGNVGLGRVTQVDIYPGRSQAKSAAVRVHRIDDFGEPQAPRYRFEVGYLQEGSAPALFFSASEQEQERVITVFRDGRFDEASGLPRAAAAALSASEERYLAGLPPMLGVTEVAQLLGITRAAVLAAIDRGSLAANKVEGRWEIGREAVAAYHQVTALRRGKPGRRKKALADGLRSNTRRGVA